MKRLSIALVCLVANIAISMAQSTRVTGIVISGEDNEPIIGATVMAKGTTTGTVTNYDGEFTLDVPESVQTMVFSYIGMTTQEAPVSSVMRIVLQSESQALDEVVVVAYGTQSSKSVTSSISSLRGDALKDVPSVSVDQMLQGRASGVSITTPSGGVGQAPVVNIRGVGSITSGTQPLYIVDGMPINTDEIGRIGGGTDATSTTGVANPLADINPSDILSVDILKDASATALYGSRAANGVILITTKKGSKGAAKVSYDMNVGFSQKTNFYKVMNAQQYMDFKNMANRNMYGQDAEDIMKPMYTSDGKLVDTNWSDIIFKNGFAQNHTVSVSGATDKATYYMSANYSSTEGIIIGDHYDRLGVRANLSLQTTDWMKIGLTSNYSESRTSYSDLTRGGATFSVSGFTRMALVLPSNLPAYNEDGTPYYESNSGIGYGNNTANTSYYNPAALKEYGNGVDTYINRIIASAYVDLTPIDNLLLRTQYGVDNSKVETNTFYNPYHGDNANKGGYATGYESNYNIWTWTNTATYDLGINNNHFNFLLGTEATQTDYNYWGVQGTGLSDENSTGIETDYLSYNGKGGRFKKALVSYFGRINYDYDYRYMFSANFRRDGYSPLGETTRWGSFGGVSAAWRISEEAFFNSKWIDDMKIKASWGLVGNADVGYYPAKTYYKSNYYGDNGAYTMDHIGDSGLKWESSQTFDVGVSIRMLNNITIDIDYYNTKATDLIMNVNQATSTGVPDAYITTNAGTMRNQGLEAAIGAQIIRTKDFSWNTNFNITFNKNKILELANDIQSADVSGYEFNNLTTVGQSLGQLYVLPTGGIDKETGYRIFYTNKGNKLLYKHDQDRKYYYEDGTVFVETKEEKMDKVLAGNTIPTYYGGWTNSLSYKRFDLNIFFQFSGGNYIYNGTKATGSDMRFWNNTTDVLKNHWSENNKNATYAKPIYGDNVSNASYAAISDWVEKGDYLRLKNVSLGYTFDTQKWSSKLGISALRLYAQAQNLFVITGYSGLDPEVSSNVQSPGLAGGIDKNTIPQARTYTLGLNVTF